MELKDGLAKPGKGQLAEELIQASDWLPHCIIVANQREVEGRNGSSWLLQLPECLLRPREIRCRVLSHHIGAAADARCSLLLAVAVSRVHLQVQKRIPDTHTEHDVSLRWAYQ